MIPRAILIMGVSGCGKSTIGKSLAEELRYQFVEADDFHSADNIVKMKAGIALDDEDRIPWLLTLGRQWGLSPKGVVMACSALKSSYREILLDGIKDKQVVFLEGHFELILKRIQERKGHFMDISLLESQFAILEEPKDALRINVESKVSKLVNDILQKLKENERE